MIDRSAVFQAINEIAFNGHKIMDIGHACIVPLMDLATAPKSMTDRDYMRLANRVLTSALMFPNDPEFDVRIVLDREHIS